MVEQLPGLEVVRATPDAARAQDSDGGMPTMEVRFSRFGTWYEIDSLWEGRFLERTEKGAFRKTIAERGDQVKILFNHGFDPQIGDKVLGPIESLSEESDSPVAVVPLFDTSYNRDLVPGLQAGVYGSSFRFVVTREEWDDEPGRSDHNPDGIPERTIKEVRLLEAGPVTFPANPDSTSGLRSMTDDYFERLRARDPQRVDALTRARESLHPAPARAGSTTRADDGAAETPPPAPPAGHPGGPTPAQRREVLFPILKGDAS